MATEDNKVQELTIEHGLLLQPHHVHPLQLHQLVVLPDRAQLLVLALEALPRSLQAEEGEPSKDASTGRGVQPLGGRGDGVWGSGGDAQLGSQPDRVLDVLCKW